MFAAYGNNIDFTQKDNLDFLKNSSFWDLFVNYFDGLENALSGVFREKIWQMIYERYKHYENI